MKRIKEALTTATAWPSILLRSLQVSWATSRHIEKGGDAMSKPGSFLADVKEIRRRARHQLSEGAVTQNYGGKIEDAIALLNHAVATEVVCVLRYKFHAICATGLSSEAVKEEFAQHATEEEEHLITFSVSGSTNSEASQTSTRTVSPLAQRRSLSRGRIWST